MLFKYYFFSPFFCVKPVSSGEGSALPSGGGGACPGDQGGGVDLGAGGQEDGPGQHGEGEGKHMRRLIGYYSTRLFSSKIFVLKIGLEYHRYLL